MMKIFRFFNKCSNYNNSTNFIGVRNYSWWKIISFLMMPFDCLVISLLYPKIEIIFWFIFSYTLRIIPWFILERKLRKLCVFWFILDSKLSTSKRIKIWSVYLWWKAKKNLIQIVSCFFNVGIEQLGMFVTWFTFPCFAIPIGFWDEMLCCNFRLFLIHINSDVQRRLTVFGFLVIQPKKDFEFLIITHHIRF